ncbi:MAG: hypothetical protein FWG64_03170 [Firmicutes bacterium]|nr:hypothetical protein [Bacillota bacterium]
MAHFKGILLHTGSQKIIEGMFANKPTFPDYVKMGSERYTDFAEEKEHATITDLKNPLDVNAYIIDREFEKFDGEKSILRLHTEVSNQDITQNTAVREIMLYANSDWELDANGEKLLVQREWQGRPVPNSNGSPIFDHVLKTAGTPFAYAWLAGPDVDNILPNPNSGGGFVLTHHYHTMEFYVLNHYVQHIEVIVAPGGSVTHKYLDDRLKRMIELSKADIPQTGTRLHYHIKKEI